MSALESLIFPRGLRSLVVLLMPANGSPPSGALTLTGGRPIGVACLSRLIAVSANDAIESLKSSKYSES